jgi:predicted nucleic acid-binding protein
MSAQTGNSPLRLENVFMVRSEKLKELRVVFNYWKESSAVLGTAAQFRLVVDTNVVLGDLLWLVAERKNPTAKTDLMEVVEAETIDLYAPPKLFDEIDEHLPKIAASKGMDLSRLTDEWESYRVRIKIAEPDSDTVQALRNGIDPDDAEFVALAQTINAAGVFSKDRHISQMGANQISVECITYLRNYSRATAIELNIKVGGVAFIKLGHAVSMTSIAGFKALIEGIGKAPDWVKLALIVGGLFIAFHPSARVRVASGLKTVFVGIAEATPIVIGEIAAAIALAQHHKVEAMSHLDNAMKELGRNKETTLVNQTQD